MTEQEAIDALEEHKKLIDKEYLKTRNSKAIEVVLNTLKEKDKTIEKLRKDNTIFALEGSRIALKHYIENNYIPIQKIKDKIGDLADTANKINNEIVEELKSNAICQEYLEDKRKELRLINRDIKTLQSLLEESEDSKDGEG